MGCDIHSVAQVYKKGKWESVLAEPGGDDRNYDSFAVMANVRNGYGFAGVTTGEGWPFISEPRGLPKDVQLNDDESITVPEYEWYGEEKRTHAWLGDHSHSYLLLSEMEEFFEKTIKPMKYTRVGVVGLEEYKNLKEKNAAPECWSGGISGPGIKVLSEDEANRGAVGTHVQMTWKEQAEDCVRVFKTYIEELRKIALEHKVPSNQVRLVFGFDS